MSKTKTYIEENLVVTSVKTLYDLLIKEKSPDAVALYNFYMLKARLDKTNRPYTTISYVMAALQWGELRVLKAKKVLKKYDLITDIKGKDAKGGIKWYVQLNYIWKQKTIEQIGSNIPQDKVVEAQNGSSTHQTQVLDSEGTNALSENDISSLSENDFSQTKTLSPYVNELGKNGLPLTSSPTSQPGNTITNLSPEEVATLLEKYNWHTAESIEAEFTKLIEWLTDGKGSSIRITSRKVFLKYLKGFIKNSTGRPRKSRVAIFEEGYLEEKSTLNTDKEKLKAEHPKIYYAMLLKDEYEKFFALSQEDQESMIKRYYEKKGGGTNG